MYPRIVLLSLGLFIAFQMALHSVHAGSDQDNRCGSAKRDCYEAGSSGLKALEREGRNTWYRWTGGDSDANGKVVGDQYLWRSLAVQTHGTVDLLQAIDSRYREQRFHRFGVMNDPDCTQASEPDQYGLWLDSCPAANVNEPVGEAAGIVGLRRFKNPKFDAKAWDLKKYLADPATVEPPYVVGVACAFCHVGFHPLHPPADPEHPAWPNLDPGIGNQYFREQIFNTAKFPASREMTPSDFRWQVANAEPPGTSDTSQVTTDHINNPGTINTIAYLNYRPKFREVTSDGVMRHVFHVLKDGADSVGSACLDDPTERPGVNDTACAAMRGYLNIGLCSDVWTTLLDPVYGVSKAQTPLHIKQAREKSQACDESWRATQARLDGLEAFLRTMEPKHLAQVDGGDAYISQDTAKLTRGKIVFAENCAKCHSSKRPPADYKGTETDWFREAVLTDDFLQSNFLSDDRRYPVSQIGTNAERSLATNAQRDQLWEEFSSKTYKELPPVDASYLTNHQHLLTRLSPRKQTAGGGGYYRTASLAGLWATAPYLHNNSVGAYNGDPSVAGRMKAFQSGMEQLLWPERRAKSQAIHRTTARSSFVLEGGGTLCVARGTPVDLITNLQPTPGKTYKRSKFADKLICGITGSGLLNPVLALKDNAPDFVQNRGHTFGAGLSDADKKALIEYAKTF